MKKKLLVWIIIYGIILFIYRSWFIHTEIIGGDWPYFHPNMVKEFKTPAPLWTSQENGGIGGTNANFPLFTYLHVTGSISNIFSIPWYIIYKLFWFWLFIILCIFSSFVFLKKFLPYSSEWSRGVGILLYAANTYILLVAGGGQMGIAFSYALLPLTFTVFHNLLEAIPSSAKLSVLSLKNAIIASLIFALQIFFDIRIAYLATFVIFLYIIFYFLFIKKFSLKLFSQSIILIFFEVILLHTFWLIPYFAYHLLSIPRGITSSSGFAFFSFSDFSHGLALLHPNWPENIFGKTYFLEASFLLLPILAFGSLISFPQDKKNTNCYRHSLFFAIIALFAIFLSKGVKEPFGEINLFLFNTIPGFNLFRDPTKYYMLIALSYSLLIPVGLTWLSKRTDRKFLKYEVVQIIFVLYFLYLIRPAVLGKLPGTFVTQAVPTEYRNLSLFLSSQSDFFRTLWVPYQSRFRFQSEVHPLINAHALLNTTDNSAMIHMLKKDSTQEELKKLGVKYVIIPYDSTSEIFLYDRKYDEKQRVKFEKELDKISWLRKIQDGRVTIYQTQEYNDHFLILGKRTDYNRISSGEYLVRYKETVPSELLFIENFHPGWQAIVDNKIIPSKKTEDGFNSFIVPSGVHTAKILFSPEKIYTYSFLFSAGVLTLLLLVLAVLQSMHTKVIK